MAYTAHIRLTSVEHLILRATVEEFWAENVLNICVAMRGGCNLVGGTGKETHCKEIWLFSL